MTSAATIDLELQAVRQQFPALSLTADGRRVVFLDNPAGTQVAQRVIDRTQDYWRTMNANQGGVFATSQRSDALIAEVRRAAAAFLNAPSPDQIVFGPNMTTLTFAMSRAIGRELQPGDEIVVTRLEHDANIAPWLALQERGIVIRFADICLPECTIDIADLQRQVTARTKLVAVTQASNVVGTIPDLPVIAALARAAGAWLWVDAVHYAPHGSIDVQAIECDFLVCSSYKFYGPHQGILYGRRERLERLHPYKVRPAGEELPGRWETGTQTHECLAGMLGAFEYLSGIGGSETVTREALTTAMARIAAHERALAARLIDGLKRIAGVRIYGITNVDQLDRRVPTVSITWAPHRPASLARWLADHQVFTWHGDHYAPELISRLGLREQGGTLRIGIAHYNTASEIDLLLEVLAAYRE